MQKYMCPLLQGLDYHTCKFGTNGKSKQNKKENGKKRGEHLGDDQHHICTLSSPQNGPHHDAHWTELPHFDIMHEAFLNRAQTKVNLKSNSIGKKEQKEENIKKKR